MSTRCQMAVYENPGVKIEDAEVFIYKHHDGYPSGVLPLIVPFLKNYNAARGIADVPYCSARLLQYLCNKSDESTTAFIGATGIGTTGMMTTGFGIDNELHHDIEYFYHISPEKIQVFEITVCRFELVKKIIQEVSLAGG